MTRSLPSVWDACVFPARAIIARAVERGINYLDTAYLYPGNEACVGAALEELGCRDRVLVATKLPHASCRRPEDPDRIFGEQLRRLRTDYVDYYLMHNVTSPAQWERLRDLGIEDWFARQRAAGRIRQVGFSYHGSADDFPVLLDAYDWDFCQIQYNYTGERYQAGTAGLLAAHARRMAVFVMEPLLGGRLADKLLVTITDSKGEVLTEAGTTLTDIVAQGAVALGSISSPNAKYTFRLKIELPLEEGTWDDGAGATIMNAALAFNITVSATQKV